MSGKGLLRDPIKYVRDRAKSKYVKGTECEICGATDKLDFHHYYTMTIIFDKWLKQNKHTITDVDSILAIRDDFIAEEYDKVYNETVTLCHDHHMELHSIYGKNPALGTAKKQKNWVQIRKEKHDKTRELAG